MKITYQVNKPEDFKGVIADILRFYGKNKMNTLLLTLQGELGAGKTTFTQQLGSVLGVTQTITSPTFTIMKQYELSHELFDTLVHIDAYRFETEDEAKPLRLEDIFAQPRTLVCVEWPERILSLLPLQAVQVQIEINKDETRQVQVIYPNESGRVL